MDDETKTEFEYNLKQLAEMLTRHTRTIAPPIAPIRGELAVAAALLCVRAQLDWLNDCLHELRDEMERIGPLPR